MSLIEIAHIKDGGAQMRVEMRPETVQDYADDMLAGAIFPPVVVYFDGTDYWLADGFHRVEAARKIGRETIEAEIKEGSARDAILHGIGSNASHGLRRTQADKQRAVERLLKDPEWARWSDRKIAEVARVDHKTVGTIRRDLSGEFPTSKSLKRGEFPSRLASRMARTSVTESVLAIPVDDVLIAECRRRGLAVEAAMLDYDIAQGARQEHRAAGEESARAVAGQRPVLCGRRASRRGGAMVRRYLADARRGRRSLAAHPLPSRHVNGGCSHPSAGRPPVREHGTGLAVSVYREPGGALSRP